MKMCVVKRFKQEVFLFLFVFLAFSHQAFSQSSSVIQLGTSPINLTHYSDILEDPNHQYSIGDINQANARLPFQPVQQVGNNFGFTKSSYWVRFTLQPAAELTGETLVELINPLIDEVYFYTPDSDGKYSVKKTGDEQLFSQRDIKYRNFVFKIPPHPGEARTYFIKLKTQGSLQISLKAWTYQAFIEHIDIENFVFGGYYGVMFLLMMSAFAFYLKIHDKLFLHYSFYLLTYIIFQLSLNGLAYQYLWPTKAYLSSQLTASSVGLVTIGGILFSGSFLNIWNKRHLFFLAIFSSIILIDIIGILMTLWGDYGLGVRTLAVVGIYFPPIVLLAGISSVLKGYRPAKYFLMAWAIFLCGVFIAGLMYLGIVPHNFITVYAIQIGSTIEVIVLGYALMDRISLLQSDKQKATELATAYLERSNKELEQLVVERTQELEEKNRRLNQLTLIDSMTGLLTHNASIEFLNKQLSLARRYDQDLSVIMLDIDKFKSINDVYGHPAGDEVIIGIADILKSSFRNGDYCGRYGGEEFIIILPETSAGDATALAEHIRHTVQDLQIEAINLAPVTASFGVSSYDAADKNADLIYLADKALYQAKKSGRNNVKTVEDLLVP